MDLKKIKENKTLTLLIVVIILIPTYLVYFNGFTTSNISQGITLLSFYLQNRLISLDTYVSTFVSIALFLNSNSYSLLNTLSQDVTFLLAAIAIVATRKSGG
jgi:hypothetical protein